MRKILFIIITLFSTSSFGQTIYSCRNGQASFYSETPIENIDAISNSLNAVLNTTSGELVLIVAYTSFKFKNPLMQEHFNEKYMESDKFPNATFKGRINEKFFFRHDTTFEVTATGILNCHGVDKERTEKATVTLNDGDIRMSGEFKVALKDHQIEVPKVVVQNIAEIIDVKFDATLTPYKKE